MPAQITSPNDSPRLGSPILLVEDNDSLREALTDTLRLFGYRVYAASCGEKAVAMAHKIQEQIALVISDLVMPGMNALQLYEALRLQPGKDKMLIITGYPMPNTAETLVTRAGVQWASKPIGFDELQRLVSDILRE